MPWESRIQSEPVRNMVIAVIMAVLLAAATAVAAILSNGDRAAPEGERAIFRSRSLGPFQVSPPDWKAVGRLSDGTGGEGMMLEHAGSGSRMTIVAFQTKQPLSPWLAMRQLGRLRPDASYLPNRDDLRMRWRSVHSDAITLAVESRSPMRVISVDGRWHLGMLLEPKGDVGNIELATFDVLAATVQDSRYEMLGRRFSLPIGMSIEIPEHLQAMARTDRKELRDIRFHPVSDSSYYALRMKIYDARTPPDLDALAEEMGADAALLGESQRPAQLSELLSHYTQLSETDQVKVDLGLRYYLVTGRWPSGYGRWEVDQVPAFALVFQDAAPEQMYRSAWSLYLGGGTTVQIQVDAEAAAAPVDVLDGPAVASVMRLMQTIVGSRNPPEPTDSAQPMGNDSKSDKSAN